MNCKKLLTFIIIFFWSIYISNTFAQSESSWIFQAPSVVLPFYSAAEDKSAIIAIAYEKKWFRCKPSVALISISGRSLGSLLRSSESGSNRNSLKLTINNKDYFSEGDTVLNTYENGTEVVSFFDDDVIEALKYQANISVSIGNNPPLFSGRSINTIDIGLRGIIESCENN